MLIVLLVSCAHSGNHTCIDWLLHEVAAAAATYLFDLK